MIASDNTEIRFSEEELLQLHTLRHIFPDTNIRITRDHKILATTVFLIECHWQLSLCRPGGRRITRPVWVIEHVTPQGTIEDQGEDVDFNGAVFKLAAAMAIKRVVSVLEERSKRPPLSYAFRHLIESKQFDNFGDIFHFLTEQDNQFVYLGVRREALISELAKWCSYKLDCSVL